MANFECPLCRSATERAGKLRYCPRCGWNKKLAAQQLRLSLRILLVAVVAAVVATVVFARSGAPQSGHVNLLMAAIPAVAYLFAYISVRRSLGKLESAPDLPNAGAAGDGAAKGAGTSAEPTAADQALLRISRPREVHLSSRGKKSLTFIAFMVCVLEGVLIWQLHRVWALAHSFEGYQRKDWALVGVVVLLVLLPLSTWRTMARERELLENGELTMGRVTKKWTTRDGATVFYEFQDAGGQTHKHSGMDYSGRLEIGMGVPVFYDRDNPKRQIAASAALHEVVTS